jgi:hypothetical protein
MLDSIVQLIRNFLCCIKDWQLFSDTWLYDPKVTQQYYDFPEPLNKTTPLEAMISVVQSCKYCMKVKNQDDIYPLQVPL